jgi:ParB family chromosome partitioning protein
MLKMSKTKVAQIESVSNNLIPEFREELNKERLTFSAAYELSGMTEAEQKKALATYEETGAITHKDVKSMKNNNAAVSPVSEENVSESDTVNSAESTETEYQTPHPEGITSICYSCTEYETCNVKTGTCTKCDQYKNRKEAYKTDEQKYSEEQDKIDRETAKKLREMEDEEKMNLSPGDSGQKIHKIRLASMYYDDVCSGRKNFELRRNDRNYKVGDILEMMEFKDGKNTGRIVSVLVTYLLENYTGIEDGYCIMGTRVIKEI